MQQERNVCWVSEYQLVPLYYSSKIKTLVGQYDILFLIKTDSRGVQLYAIGGSSSQDSLPCSLYLYCWRIFKPTIVLATKSRCHHASPVCTSAFILWTKKASNDSEHLAVSGWWKAFKQCDPIELLKAIASLFTCVPKHVTEAGNHFLSWTG